MQNQSGKKQLIVITGPTAVGKTDLCIRLAKEFSTVILSADSRQFYQQMSIGTAKPGKEELAAVPHYFIGQLSIDAYYNVSMFEQQAMDLLDDLFQKHERIILTGGSGLYIDALCNGVDNFPDIDPEVRLKLKNDFAERGIEWLRDYLKQLDPEYYNIVDIHNPNRMTRAIEVCLATKKPYSQQRFGVKKTRPFEILRIALNRPREILFERIHQRTNAMIDEGLVEEVRSLLDYRHLNALNTVGYKEIFAYLDGEWTLEQAIEKIKTNTRRYAKRQITWFKRTPDYHWMHPDEYQNILDLIKQTCDA